MLKNEKCQLIRHIKQSDKANLVLTANNPNVFRCLRDGFPHPYTVADADKYACPIF